MLFNIGPGSWVFTQRGPPFRRNRRMENAEDNDATSLWLKHSDKELIRKYRNDVFDTEHVGLRHAVRHAIKQAQGDDE